ncbi:hypothetical protein BGX34_006376 [Mortierella sp. NVP85]|nr:hypothetical protein BGX34_006376 [Mortierella sp. NVP85]
MKNVYIGVSYSCSQGGIWDPVGDEFKTHRWAFHLMMAIYFFFTVIVMLNVLIALINKAYEKGDDGWRLVWIESRLRFIESAENLSYHIPGFRQTHNYFPKEIYFSATLQQVKEYRQKYNINSKQKEEEDDELNIAEDWLQDIPGEDGYQDEEPEEDENAETGNGNNNNSNNNNEDNSEEGDEDADGNDGGDEGDDDGDNGNNGKKISGTTATKAVDKKPKKKQSESKLDRRSSTREKKDKKEKKIAKKKGPKVAIEPGWTTDEEGGNEDKDGGAQRAQDARTIRRLNTKIGDLHEQVGELKTQIGGLQKHLATQLSAQRQQAQRQREEYQELKNLLQALHKHIDAFSPTSTPPQSSELRLYTWKNATLGEIASLVKQAIPDLVSQAGTGAQLSFRHIYLDIHKGIFVGRDVGKVYLDTPQPSPPPQESASRFGDIPKDGLFTKDMHQSNSRGNGASISTETGVTTDGGVGEGGGAGGTGGSVKESAAAPGGHPSPPPPPGASGSGLKASEKTLASIKFVIGDYLDIAITHGTTSGFSSSPMQRRQYNNSGGGAIRHHHGGHRSGRQGGGGGHNPLGDRLAGRLGGGGGGGNGGGGSGGGGGGHSHNGHGQGTNGRRGQMGLDVQNEPNWKSRGRGR